MAETATTLQVNRPPNITWHRLKMNDVPVELEEWPLASGAASAEAAVATPCPAAQPTSPALCAALLHACMKWVPAESTLENSVQRVVPAASALAAPEANGHSMMGYWESGMGGDAENWLEEHARQRLVVDIPAGQAVEKPVVINVMAQGRENAVLLLDVIAREGSRVHVVVQSDSDGAGQGTVGVYARIVAFDRAHVGFTSLQTLDDGWKYLENVGLLLADDARVDVRQTMLGGQESYVGLGSNQVGDESALNVDVRYLGTGSHVLDFNYAMRQRGCKTACTLNANGVLVDSARKTLRDTIDLVHGCKGSVGNENETVLLANETVRNRSMPVILCNEDDVQGNHGATIGHVNPAQLEYLRSRGLTVDQVESLLTSAVFDYAAEHAPTEAGAAAVRALAVEKLGQAYGEDD